MSMVKIDEKSNEPIFQQIAREIERLIMLEVIRPGEFIPSVREFAVQHSVNPNTVAKAYQLLQVSKVVEPVRGMGLVVVGQDQKKLVQKRKALLSSRIEILLQEMAALGFSKDDLIQAINESIPTRRT
ncbi:MAG: GntR family transcriptional regulator [Proteobacteria bacterium]|nr:GntR family transcriptional regulator [Pseudomonadota bacterium]